MAGETGHEKQEIKMDSGRYLPSYLRNNYFCLCISRDHPV